MSDFDPEQVVQAALERAASPALLSAAVGSMAFQEALLRFQRDAVEGLRIAVASRDPSSLEARLKLRSRVIVSIAKSIGGVALETDAERALESFSSAIEAAAHLERPF